MFIKTLFFVYIVFIKSIVNNTKYRVVKYQLLVILFLFLAPSLSAQEGVSFNEKTVDSLYKEDQFYIGITYNLIGKRPTGVSQSRFSAGYHFGYTKDMPINKNRNRAIGVGLGFSFNNFNQNILISETADNNINFQVIDNASVDYSKNKFATFMVEMPIEYRWRTSTAKDYKFWRVYTGVKLGYRLGNRTAFESDSEKIKLSNIKAFNKMQYGAFISAGYNTWNFYAYYGLNSIFKKDIRLDNTVIDANAIKIGLMFYIL